MDKITAEIKFSEWIKLFKKWRIYFKKIKERQAAKSSLKKCSVCRLFNSVSGDQCVLPLTLDQIDKLKPF